ncbi:MAG: hypothetical protein WA154_08820 [Moraxellaceae bacterium]
MCFDDQKLKVVESYSKAFRDLINDRVDWRGDPATNLRLRKPEDWVFVCVAMDILDDASLALHNFLKFGISGPTKHDDVGEKYLRLYGLLSAAYIQQQAAIKLHHLMDCPNQREFKRSVDKTEIRMLRHQLASHSLDCMDSTTNSISAFVPVRIWLDDFSCTVTESRGDSSASYNLKKAVHEHCDFMLDILDATYEKTYKTIFKENPKKKDEHSQNLGELREEKSGAIILKPFNKEDPRIFISAPSDSGEDN